MDDRKERVLVRRERLIQEELIGQPDYPWRMMIACILLNRTRAYVVRPILSRILLRWSTPEILASSENAELREIIRPLGLGTRRANSLVKMSAQYVKGLTPRTMFGVGIGKYAYESWKIFVEGNLDFDPTDVKLRAYVLWERKRRILE
jgi:methyl-CpG-binding domain protein 4